MEACKCGTIPLYERCGSQDFFAQEIVIRDTLYQASERNTAPSVAKDLSFSGLMSIDCNPKHGDSFADKAGGGNHADLRWERTSGVVHSLLPKRRDGGTA